MAAAPAGYDLLRLFFEYPFPVLPLVDADRCYCGLVRRRAAEAYALARTGESLAEFLAGCRGEMPTLAEEEIIVARAAREGRALPLLDLTGALVGFWREGRLPWSEPAPEAEPAAPLLLAAMGIWPFAAQYDARGMVRRHSPLPRGWRQPAAGRPLRLADFAWRLETARRTGVTHGYFRRAGRQFRFVLEPGADGGGLCRITPLFPVEELLEYLQEGTVTLPKIFAACERELLHELLAGGADRRRIAELLGIPRQTLAYKLRKHR